ncbi:MAG: T9SS type A sorting domain-containing protein [Bacteroidia bacterium]
MKKIALILAVLIPFTGKATKITSVICGNWSDTTTWNLNRVPQTTDTVVVNTFVSFDMDFSSISPGMLEVTECGTLCGLHNYTGCFNLYGVVYINTFHLIYGISNSSSPSFNVLSYGIVTNTGTQFISTGSLCVGCTSNCQNCSTNNKEETACTQSGITQNKNLPKAFSIYPNPANDKVYIDGKNITEIKLVNVLGNEVLHTKEKEIEVSSLTNGIYFIEITTTKNTYTQKVIVRHE